MEEFIEIVRAHSCLWNPLNPGHRDIHLREQAWQNVVERYNNSSMRTVKAAKNEWKKLRDNHREALKRAKLGQNKLLPAQITTWKYAKAMQFLEPHMKYRVTENIEIEPFLTTTITNCNTMKNSDQDVSTSDIIEHGKSEGQQNKRRCTDTSVHPMRQRVEQKNDALESFFKCVLQSTRDMPPWMQTQVKKKSSRSLSTLKNVYHHRRNLVLQNKMMFTIVTLKLNLKCLKITPDNYMTLW